jgi:hypothetical protein
LKVTNRGFEWNHPFPFMISGFHWGDYEECLHLDTKIPVRSSHETLNVSATEPSRLMIRKISGFHSGDNEEYRPLGGCSLHVLQKHVSTEIIASIFRVERIRERGATLAVVLQGVISHRAVLLITF